MPGLHDGPAITNTVTRYAFSGYCPLVMGVKTAEPGEQHPVPGRQLAPTPGR